VGNLVKTTFGGTTQPGRLLSIEIGNLMRRKFGLVGLVVMMFAMAAPLGAAFGVFQAASAATSNNVIIEGAQRVERETILSYLQFEQGKPFDSSSIDASIKALFQTGLFSDVSITQRGGAVVVRVAENPLINLVNFEGNSEIDDDTLQKEVEIKERMIYTKARVQSDTQRILTLYQSKGFYNVRVVPNLIRLADNRVNVAFVISENGKTEVKQITFTGNKSIRDGALKGILVTKEKSFWNPFLVNDTYDADRLQYDKELLRRHYLKNGFADVQIVSADARLTPDGNGFDINFVIDEGPRYSVADVAINVGDAKLDASGLTKVVKTGVGDTFDASKVDKSVENLTLEASNQGFVFAKVEPKVDRDPTKNKVNITYNISEGARAYIERIDITGNTHTRDEVIRRELRLYEGDAFNRTLIERARRRLTALDFFSKIDFKENQGSAPDKVIIDVDIAEKSTGSVTFSVGYSTTDAVIGSVALAERNLFGKGLQASIDTSLSYTKQQLNMSFTDPYFLGMPLSAGFDLFASSVDNSAYSSYSSWQVGGALRTGFRLDEYSSMNFKYSLTYRDINGVNASVASPTVIASQGTSFKSALGANYQYDDLDNPLDPTSGFRGQLNTEFAGLGGSAQYAKAEVHAWYFLPLLDEQVVVKLEGNAGHIQALGNEVSIQDRFFKGGDTFRGFSSSGVGPRQENNAGGMDSIGGKTYAIATVEAQFPLGLPEAFGISGEVFSDFGTVFDGGDNPTTGGGPGCGTTYCAISDSMGLRASIGAGMIWKSPFGPLRFEFAYPLMKQANDVTQNFRFSIGTRF
jgi:outer membrane protein insertion porin family